MGWTLHTRRVLCMVGCHGHPLPGCALKRPPLDNQSSCAEPEGSTEASFPQGKDEGRQGGNHYSSRPFRKQEMSQQRGSGEGGRNPRSDGWGSESGWATLALSLRQPFRASSPLPLTHLDTWDKKASPRAQSSVWSGEEGTSGGGLYFTRAASSPASDSEGSLRAPHGAGRWRPPSRLAPEGAPPPLSPSAGAELRAALMESGARRAELIQRLREAQERLDGQTDLLQARDTQLQRSQTSTQMLELRQKQLADAVSSLEQEKETAELRRFEECHSRGELQDKVLQLELDLLKLRSTLETKACYQQKSLVTLSPLGCATNSSPLSKTLPSTQEDFSKQRRRQMERELREVREALGDAQDRLRSLEEEKDLALQDLRSSKKGQLAVQTQVEEARQRLSSASRTQRELRDQLSEARSRLGKAGLERDLLSSKVLRIEDSLEDVKHKLSTAMSDKDRIMQEKVELHQRVTSLELQLQRAQSGREGFTDQVCELHGELAEAKSHVNRLAQEKVQTREELVTLKESHKTAVTELGEARQRLEAVQGQLHELEAERLIHTNQIAALETERSQLIGEKEELASAAQQSSQEEVTELKESCHNLRESHNSLLLENQELQRKCRALEAGLSVKEAELRGMEAELRQGEEARAQTEADAAREAEELRRVGAHWKERWQEAALALRTAQDQLEDAGRQNCTEMSQLRQEKLQLTQELEKLQREALSSQAQVQFVLQQKADMEAELHRVKESGAQMEMELIACRQQLDLEKNSSQVALSQLSTSPVGEGGRGGPFQESPGVIGVSGWMDRGLGNAAEAQDRDTQTDFSPTLEHVQFLQMSSSQQDIVQTLNATSRQEVDGELGQVRAELQKVWDTLRERDTVLGEHQQELQSARVQASQQCSEVQRLEQQLRAKEEELEKKEQALRRMESSREAERTETRITVSSLEMKLAEVMDLGVKEAERRGSPECTRSPDLSSSHLDSLQAELEDMRKRNDQLQQERDRVVQTLKQLQQHKTERSPPESKRETRPGSLDHEKQRRLVTEQLKSLFKEREACGKSAAPKVIQNVMDTVANQRRRERELQSGRSSLPGASNGQQGAPENAALQGMQEQVTRLTQELHRKTDKMTSMSEEICDLRERNENLLTAKLRFQKQIQRLREREPRGERQERGVPRRADTPVEGESQPEPFPDVVDGTYLAKQVNVGSSEEGEGDEEEREGNVGGSEGDEAVKEVHVWGSEEEEGSEEGKAVRVEVAGGSSPLDPWSSWDSLPSPACTDGTSTPLFRSGSIDTLNLPLRSAAWSPVLSPHFPLRGAVSQDCLLSPRAYRPQSARETR